MARYVFPALGAALFMQLAPWIWKNVAITAIGSHWQATILVALGAMLGGVVGEKVGASSGRK